jgi:hypothetical protein
MPPEPMVFTADVIARLTGSPIYRIRYMLKSRGIGPIERAGTSWVYDQADAERLVAEIRRIDAVRESVRRAALA